MDVGVDPKLGSIELVESVQPKRGRVIGVDSAPLILQHSATGRQRGLLVRTAQRVGRVEMINIASGDQLMFDEQGRRNRPFVQNLQRH